MNWPSPFSFAFYFCLFAMQAFVARSVIERPTALKELIIYGTASAAVHLVTKPCPVLIPKILFVTAAHVALHRKVFKAPIFPDAVASVALPLSLGFSSHQILLPLLSWLLETELDASVREFLFFLPSLLMAAYYGLRQMLSPRGPTPAGVQPGIRNIGAIAAVSILLHIRAIFNLTRTNGTGSRLSTVYAVAGTVLAAIVAATLLRQIRQTEQQRKKADYHALKHRVKSSALRTLREERHEFRNQLALISTYLQMGEKEKAQHCIDYAAASLSQEGGGPYLPEDAWLMVLEGKKQTALMCGIEFTVEIKAEPPYAFAEQRLLPKLISNLVDNAFAAALKAPGPRVSLLWEERETGRILQVSNNGPPITAEQGRKIFQAGVTTKDNKEGRHGWGLVICSRIATELNGTLSYTSTPTETSFTLRLPPADVNGEERAGPLP